MAKPWERDWGAAKVPEAVTKPTAVSKPWERKWGGTPVQVAKVAPKVEAAPDEGPGRYGAALQRGIGTLKESGAGIVTGTQAMLGDAEAAQKGFAEAKAADVAEQKVPGPKSTSFQDIQDIAGKQGIVAAAKEVPGYLGEKALESLPSTGGPLAAGIAGTAVGGPLVGLIAGIGTNIIQTYGTHIDRQIQEAKAAGELDPVKAALTAIPSGALDYVTDRFTVGLGGAAKAVAKEGALKYIAAHAVKASGGEAVTETAQQVLEREAAGLPLGDEKAMGEYKESAAAGAGLGLIGGGAGATYQAATAPKEEPAPAEAPPTIESRTADITQRAQVATDEILASEEPVVPVIESAPIPEGIPTPEGGGLPTAEAQQAHAEKNAAIREEVDRAARWGAPERSRVHKMLQSGALNTPEGIVALEDELQIPSAIKFRDTEIAKDLDAARIKLGMEPSPQAKVAPVTETPVTETPTAVPIAESPITKATPKPWERDWGGKPTVTKPVIEASPAIPEAHIEHAIKTVATIREGLARPNAPEIKTIPNMLHNAAKNMGVKVTPKTPIADVLDAVEEKIKQAQEPAAVEEAPTPEAPVPTVLEKQFPNRGAAQRAIASTKNPELSVATHEPIEVEPGKYVIAPKERATAMEAPSVAGAPPITPAPPTQPSAGIGATPPIGHSVERAIAEIRPPRTKSKLGIMGLAKRIWTNPRNAKYLAIDYIQTMTAQADARYINQLRRRLVSLGLPPTVIQKLLLEASSSQTVRDTSTAGQAVIEGTMAYNKDLSKWESVYKEGENIDAIYGSLIKINKQYNESEDQTRGLFNILMEGRRVLGMYAAADKVKAEAATMGKVDGRAYLKENKNILELPEAMNMTREEAQSKADILIERPEFSEPIKIWNKIRENVIKVMVDSGRFTLSQAENYWAVAEYVPFYRVMTIEKEEELENAFLEMSRGSAGGITKGQKLHKIKGHTKREVNDILLNMEQWMSNSFGMAIRAHKGRTLVDLAMDWMPEGTIEKVGRSSEGATRIFRNGENEFYKFEDPLMPFALNSIPTITHPAVRFIAHFTTFLRNSIVLDPIFTVAQIPQDTLEAMFSSGVKNPLMLIPEVISEFAKSLTPKLAPSRAHENLRRMGIVGERDFQAPTANNALDVGVGLSRRVPIKGFLNKSKQTMHTFSMKGDNAMRQAVYNRTMKETGDKALAAERASEIMNFRRRGASGTMDGMRQTIPFFGASMQVLNVALKTLSGTGVAPTTRKQAYKTLAATYTTYLALSFAYSWAKSDDDDYQKLDTRTKNTHLMYMGTDQPLMIPIRQSIFTLPFAIANTVWDTLLNEGTTDPVAARKGVSDAFWSVVFSTPFGVGLIKPAFEVGIDHDFFTGRDIAGKGLEDLDTAEKYTPTTSELGKLLGSTGLISPVSVDHLLRGWFGYVGSGLMTLSNIAAAEGFNVPLPAKSSVDWVREIPGMHAFIGKEISSGDLNKFYEAQKDVQGAVKTYTRLAKGDDVAGTNKSEAYEEKNQYLLDPAIKKELNSIQSQLSKIREEENIIIQTPYSELSAEEKRLELKQLALDRNEIVAEITEIRREAQGLD